MALPSKEIIAEIIAKHDPEGLIRMGAPSDEYMPEADLLLSYLIRFKSNTEEELLVLIQITFNEMFSRDYNLVDAYRKGYEWPFKPHIAIAGDIYRILEK